MQTIHPSTLLIAPPGIPDRRFRNAVIMLTHSTEQGDFGLCVNRQTTHSLQEVTEPLDLGAVPDLSLYWGGPVNPGTIWMLHDTGWSIDQSIEIDSDWSMTSHADMFTAIADGYEPLHYRMFMGFCAWQQGQLARELVGEKPWNHKHSWLTAENLGPEWLLGQDPDKIWESATTLSAHQAVDSWL